MYQTIMVPFTDWRFDGKGLSAAVHLARRSAARLHIVHVMQGKSSRKARRAEELAFDSAVNWAGDEMNESVSFRIITSTLSVARTDRIADGLAEYVKENQIELVVMTRRKHSAERILFGSVGERLLALVACPILFVPDRLPRLRLQHSRLLVPLDGSPASEDVLPDAASFASLLGGSVTLLRVIPHRAPEQPGNLNDTSIDCAAAEGLEAQRYLDRTAEKLRAAGTHVFVTVAFGEPVRKVVDQLAGADRIDVVAVAAASHGLVTRDVATQMLHDFDTALLVRPQSSVQATRAPELVTAG